MRSIWLIALILNITLILCGCPRVNSPRDPIFLELQEINKKIDAGTQQSSSRTLELQRKLDVLQKELISQQKTKADYSYSMNQIVEELAVIKQQLRDSTQLLNELTDKVTFMQQAVNELTAATGKAGNTAGAVAALGPEKIYQTARSDYNKQNYELAINGFKQFISQYPDAIKAGNAQYWIGESYYSMKKYSLALKEFDKVIKKFSKNIKVSSAQLKKAFCYIEIGKKYDAKKLLTEVSKKYKGTREAEIALQKLKKLGR